MPNAPSPVVAPLGAVNEKPILFSSQMIRALLEGRKTQTRRIVDVTPRAVLGKKWAEQGWEVCPEEAVVGDLSWLAIIGGGGKAGVMDLRKYQQLNIPIRHPEEKNVAFSDCGRERIYCPYGSPGSSDGEVPASRLWVKETFALQTMERPWSDGGWAGCYTGKLADHPKGCEVIYRADGHTDERAILNGGRWRPSIFMPRWASRITLEIESVRVERLQDISEEDAEAEGCELPPCTYVGRCHSNSCPRHGRLDRWSNAYRLLWESINGKGSWALNPWVWVIGFRRLEAAR